MNEEKNGFFDRIPDMNLDGKHDAVDYLIFEDMMRENGRNGKTDGDDPDDLDDLNNLDDLDDLYDLKRLDAAPEEDEFED